MPSQSASSPQLIDEPGVTGSGPGWSSSNRPSPSSSGVSSSAGPSPSLSTPKIGSIWYVTPSGGQASRFTFWPPSLGVRRSGIWLCSSSVLPGAAGIVTARERSKKLEAGKSCPD